MKRLNCFLVLFALIILWNCSLYSDCKVIALSGKDIKWIPNYKLHDTLIYSNKTEKRQDTIIITKAKFYLSPCNKFELGPNQYQTFVMVARLLSSKNSYKDSTAFVFSLSNNYKSDSSFNCDKYITVFGLSSKIKIDSNGNMLYSNANSDTSMVNYGKIRSFLWNKDEGLQLYTTNDSTIYSLLKKY